MTFLTNIFWNSEEKRLRAFFRILLLILLAGLFANLLALFVGTFNELLQKSMMNFLIMLAILLSIYLIGRYVDKRAWSDFGISLVPIKQLLYGAGWGALLVFIIFLVQYVLGWLSLEELQMNQFPATAFGLVFLGQVFRYICGSVFEEAFSRGYLLLNIAEGLKGKLTAKQSVAIAYVLSSSIFGLLHLANEGASFLSSLNLILIGLLLGWMVIKTGKLHFSIGLHACWNIFQNNVFGFANSGKQSIVSVYSFHNSGNSLWTGGAFGIEGGLLCTMTVLAALIVLSYPELLGIRKLNQKVLR